MNKIFRFLERLIYPVAVFTAALGVAYWYWTTTPSYALTAVVVAVKNRDVQMFEKYVDIDSVTAHAFDDLVDGPISSEILGRQNSFIGMGFVKFFKHELVELAHGKIINFVEDGKLKIADNLPTTVNPLTAVAVMNSGQILQAANKEGAVGLADGRDPSRSMTNSERAVSTAAEPDGELNQPFHTSAVPGLNAESQNKKFKRMLKEYGISKYGYRGVKYLTIVGNKADLGIEFFSPKLNQNWVTDWQLEDVGGHWRVTKLSNLAELVKTYIDSRDH